MIFNDRLIFIHIGKTGGMSCTAYLLNNLAGPVHSVHQEAEREAKQLNLPHINTHLALNRHVTLERGLDFIAKLNGKTLSDFEQVVAVFRHPLTLEYSLFEHLKKPHVIARRKDSPDLLALAQGDFLTFIREAGHHRPGLAQQDYVLIDGEIPECVSVVKFEQLARELPRAVAAFLTSTTPTPFPHNNMTNYSKTLRQQVNAEVLDAVYEKHQFLFDKGYYDLESF